MTTIYLQARALDGCWYWVAEAQGGVQLTERQEDAMKFADDEPAVVALVRAALEARGSESRVVVGD